jgi:SAM-dependent methyltransferase
VSTHGAIEARSRDYYDRISGDYDRLLDTAETRAMRQCFWQRAEALLPPAARILDFGAGTGIDAQHFADLGHRVVAYDLSRGMIEILERRCEAHLAAGTILPLAGTLAETRDSIMHQAPYDAVICNLAVFSLMPKIDDTLRLFGAAVRPGGFALICIQNPWFRAEMRHRGFWRALLRMPLVGVIRYPFHQSGYNFRHSPWQIERSARRDFAPDRSPAPQCCRDAFPRWGKMRLLLLHRR